MDQETKDRTRLGTGSGTRTASGATGAPPSPRGSSELPTIAPDRSFPARLPESTAPILPVSALPTRLPESAAPSSQPLVGPSARPTVDLSARATPDAATGPGAPFDGAIDADPDALVGQTLCGYTIRNKLAEGGMGVVYEGVHAKIGRRCAIKVLKPEFCRSPEVVERFHQEARAVNAIHHENIVDISDFGRDAYGREFFVMEYLEGEPLSGLLRRGVLAWSEAFPILEQILRALKAAHDKGFVHRDLKPDNIWLRYVDGRIQVKLLDFGIAKLMGSDSPRDKLTRTGAVIGTPHYMSPEQINGSRDVDHRTDLYAMGVIIYEMFAGVTPFVGDTLQAIMTGHLFTEPPRLAAIPANLGVPAPVAEIVDRMLVKDPTGRYDSVADALADLHDVSRNRPPANAETLRRSRPPGPPASSPEPRLAGPPRPRRTRALWILAALGAGGLAVTGLATRTAQVPTSETVVAPAPGPTRTIVVTSPTEPRMPPPLPVDDVLRDNAETAIRRLLADVEPGIRIDAAEALTRMQDRPSIPRLAELTERDPDDDVRARVGYQLGVLGAKDTAPLLERLESVAATPHRTRYTAARARLGDRQALKRLSRYARSKDLPVAVIAGFALADIVVDIAQPGNRKVRDTAVDALAALAALAAREAELVELDPGAGMKILMKGAALRDRTAREQLYAALEEPNSSVRFAAAAMLARLGDDAGREVLRAAFADPGSPNQLAAAVALIALGEYAGLDLMIAKLADEAPAVRQLAATGLGEIGERTGLEQLVGADRDKDAHVRIAAAAAIVAIVGLAPQVLARASSDWTRSALDSPDWVVRRAAAGVLADIPAKEALPLLARAFADRNAEVRDQAARSAGKIKTRESAETLMAVVEQEADPGVQEQQVKALGAIGDAVAHDVLERISATPGRIGVIAAGALISVGDAAGLTRLEIAIAARQTDLRLAAVEAASVANNPIVVPTLKIGLFDRVFEIRFTAAEGLAGFNAEKADAVPVLHAAVNSKDASLIGRALAALARFGEQLRGLARSPADMVDSPDPRQRLAAVPAVRALPVAERVPLLRRLVADPELEVRRAAVDAIEDVATKDREPEQAVRLYRPLVRDPDPIVRSKASGQLSRWSPPPPPPGTRRPVIPVRTPDQEAKIEEGLKEKATEASLIATEVTATKVAVENVAAEIEASISVDTPNERELQRVKQLQRVLRESQDKLEAAEKKAWVIATNAGDLAGTGVGAGATVAATLANVRRIARDTRTTREVVVAKVAEIQTQADEFHKINTPDIQILLDGAKVLIDQDNIAAAGAKLAQAAKLVRRAGAKSPRLDELHAELYVRMARDASDPAQKRALLERAAEVYRRIAATAGARAQVASDRLDEIVQELGASVQP